MKIRLDELRERYASSIADRTSRDRKICPSPEEINACLRGPASKKAKNTLAEHITRCSFCLEEFQFVLDTLRLEKELLQGIEKHCGLRSFRVRKIREKTAGYFKLRQIIISIQARKKHMAAALTAAALLIAAGTLYVSLNRKQSLRTFDQYIIKPLHPVNKKVSKTSFLFRWREQESVEHYVIELFDETLFPLWKSPKTYENVIELPPHIADKLSSGSTCFWFVTGFTPQGQKIESPLTAFSIKK